MAGEETGVPPGTPWPEGSSGNRLLDGLATADAARLLPHLKAVRLRPGELFGEAAGAGPCFFFPCRGAILSLLAVCEDGRTAEAISVGSEGMLGPDLMSLPHFGHVQVQMPGEAFRIGAASLAAAMAESITLRDAIAAHDRALLVRVVQSAICAALHSAEARVSRWLLTMQDRVGVPDLPVTQDMVAEMLGIRRTTVTRIIAQLSTKGVIRHRRSRVTVLDRPGLEGAACDCHRVLQRRLRYVAPALYPG